MTTTATRQRATVTEPRRWRCVCLMLPLLLGAGLFFSACSRTQPQAALDASVRKLQSALEEKNIQGVLSLLDEDFAAPAPEDGREWARRTMLLMFSRYRNIRIMVLSSENRIDAQAPDRAASNARVALIGAEGLIPENARRFQVRLGWIKRDRDWKLTRMEWE